MLFPKPPPAIHVLIGNSMPTAVRLVKQAVKTYDSVLQVRAAAQSKLDALLASQVFYTLFEHDNTHPYFGQLAAAQKLAADYERLAAMLLSCTLGTATLADELRRQHTALIRKGQQVPDAMHSLLALKPASARSLQASHMGLLVVDLYSAATFIWSNCDAKAIKFQLLKVHGKKAYKKHLEVPPININVPCKAAVKHMKKLAAMLLDLTVKGKSMRNELEKQHTMLMLKTSAPDRMLQIVLALKDK